MSNNINQLIILCHRMYEDGKTPTVGILRSKAPFKASVTEAIEAIKRFNASKPSTSNVETTSNSSAENERASLAERVDMLEQEVSELKTALARILQAR